MAKIIMLKGLPGSKKSTWAKEQCKNGNFVRVSKDELRKMLGGYSSRKEKTVLQLRNVFIRQGIQAGHNVIVDDTNLSPKHERTIRVLAKELGVKLIINDSFLKESPEECIKRDLRRGEDAVGEQVIWELFYKYVSPNPIRKLEESDKPRAVICALDGCLCLGLGKKEKEKIADPFIGCVLDSLYSYGQDYEGNPYPKIILLSSRSESVRKETEEWLENNSIPYDILFMREVNDNRESRVVKEEIYHEKIEKNYAVLGCIEDDASVVRLWQSLGLRTANMGLWGAGSFCSI